MFRALAKTVASAALGVVMMTGTASAATVVFDLTGNGEVLGATEQFTSGTGPVVTLDVTSGGGEIQQNERGIGVTGPPDNNRVGVGESLEFAFSPEISIEGAVVFLPLGGEDTIRITNLTDSSSATVTASGIGSTFFSIDEADLAGLTLLGTGFLFETVSSTGPSPGVRIASVTVNAIPVPAAGLMLISALGGILVVRRRRPMA